MLLKQTDYHLIMDDDIPGIVLPSEFVFTLINSKKVSMLYGLSKDFELVTPQYVDSDGDYWQKGDYFIPIFTNHAYYLINQTNTYNDLKITCIELAAYLIEYESDRLSWDYNVTRILKVSLQSLLKVDHGVEVVFIK